MDFQSIGARTKQSDLEKPVIQKQLDLFKSRFLYQMSVQRSAFKSRIIAYTIGWLFPNDKGQRSRIENLPRIRSATKLIKWGLWSEAKDSLKIQTGLNLYPKFILTFQLLMLLRWLMALRQDELRWTFLLGDFTMFLPGESIWYKVPFSMCTLQTLIVAGHFKLAGLEKLTWLWPLEVCYGTVDYKDLEMDEEQAADLWHRVLLSTFFGKNIIRGVLIGATVLIGLVFGNYWPQSHLGMFGIFWAVITVYWFYCCALILLGSLTIFHQVCFYVFVRFEKINQDAKEIQEMALTDAKSSSWHDRIIKFISDHNSACLELDNYNKFWSIYMAISLFLFVPFISFIVFIALMADMAFLARGVSIFISFLFFGIVCILTFSAGAVAEAAHESYTIMNSLAQIKLPLAIRAKLQMYIQRLGGPTIGFSCWNLFTITYDSYLHVILVLGSYFLLLMDVIRSSQTPFYQLFVNSTLNTTDNSSEISV